MTITHLSSGVRLSRSTGKTIVGVLGSGLFGLIVGVLLVALIATQFLGYKVSTIQSYSMEPELTRGDLLITRPVSAEDVQEGDVILFEQGVQTRLSIAHRVHNVLKQNTTFVNTTTGDSTSQVLTMFRTKGDANDQPDAQLVQVQDLEGKLWFVVPGVGLVLHEVPIQMVLFALVALTAGAWALYELRRKRSSIA